MNEVETGTDDNWLANAVTVLKQRWWLVAAVTIAAVLAAILYLRTAKYLYTAELRVYAAPSTTGQAQGGGLGGLASLAGIAPAGGEPATPFRLYLEGIRAREVAERLARDRDLMHAVFAAEWDAPTRSWRERRGLGSSIKHGVWSLLGLPLPTWRAPDAARLEDFIGDTVVVTQSVKTPLVSITMDSADPRFGVRFLTTLGTTVDSYLREKEQDRTRSNISYLSDKLRTVTQIEQRQALFQALSDQERQAMLANSLAPYAANPFGVAVVSINPTTPRQVPLLLAGLFGGLIAGIGIALLLGPRRRAVAMIESA